MVSLKCVAALDVKCSVSWDLHTEFISLDLISMPSMSSSVAEGNILTEAMSKEIEKPVAY